jgi:hypothetical protein
MYVHVHVQRCILNYLVNVITQGAAYQLFGFRAVCAGYVAIIIHTDRDPLLCLALASHLLCIHCT